MKNSILVTPVYLIERSSSGIISQGVFVPGLKCKNLGMTREWTWSKAWLLLSWIQNAPSKSISIHCEGNRSSYQVVNFARTIISIIALDLVLTYVTLHSWKLNWYINNKLSNNNKQLFFAKNQQKLRQKIIPNWRSKIIVRKIRLLSRQNLVLGSQYYSHNWDK